MKWLKLTIAIPLAGAVLYGAPIVPRDMKWVGSNETLQFETADGDLGFDEYAIFEGEYRVRIAPKSEASWVSTTSEDAILGKTLVAVRCEGCASYSYFQDEKGKRVRTPFQGEYRDLKTVKNAPQPRKTKLVTLFSASVASAAIALDGTSDGSGADNEDVTSVSWSHTVTSNTEGIIIVPTGTEDATDTDRPVTGVTYNAAALTKLREDDDATNNITSGMWYRVAPDTGANTITVSFTGTVAEATGGGVSLTAVDQSTPVDASATETGTDSATPSVTTLTDNAWVVDSTVADDGLGMSYADGGTQTTLYILETSFSDASLQAGYFGPQSPAGVVTFTWTCSGISCSATEYISTIASFKFSGSEAGATTIPNPLAPEEPIMIY